MKKLNYLTLAAAIVNTVSLGIPAMAAANFVATPIIDYKASECPDYEHIHEENASEEDKSFSSGLYLSEVHCQSSGGTIGRLLISGRSTDIIKSESSICNHRETEENDTRYYYQKVTSYECSECEFSVTRVGTPYWGSWVCT